MYGDRGDLLVELAQLGAALLIGLRHPLDDLGELFLKGLDALLDLLAHGLGQGVEDLRLDDLAFVHRRHGEAGRRAQDRDVLAVRLGIQGFEGLLLAGAEFLVDGAAARLVVLALEHRGQRVAQLVDGADHALHEAAGASRRQLQRPWAVRRLEIVDVDPIRRRRQVLELALQMLMDGRGLAGRRGAEHEDIEVVARHVGAELDGLERTILTNEAACGLELGGRLEAERGRIDRASQLTDGEGRMRRSGGEPVGLGSGAFGWLGRGVLVRFGGLGRL